MCCKTSVYPVEPSIVAAVMAVGQFRPIRWHEGQPGLPVAWERLIEEEGTLVIASLQDSCLDLNIRPAVSVFSHHSEKRIAASVYFEIAARYAEKVNGTVLQRATVMGCRDGEHGAELTVARYPEMPLSFERVCPGFQAVLLGGSLDLDQPKSA
jgi:hypothetical protein